LRVLLTCVGNRDPIAEENNEEGAILTFMRFVRPDVVVMFPTQTRPGAAWKGTEERAEMTKDLILKDADLASLGVKQCIIQPMVLDDPRDYHGILRHLREYVPKFTSGASEVFVNVSSGTSQMEGSWLVLGSSGLVGNARFFQVSKPMEGRRTPEERVSEIKPGFVREEMVVERFAQNLRSGLYELAEWDVEELYRITAYPSRKFAAECLQRVVQGYAAWDNLDYKKALDKLRSASSRIENLKEFRPLQGTLERQVSVLRSLVGSKEENKVNLCDIYYNAHRRYSHGQYADCLARIWRLVEGLYYHRLRSLDIDPLDPSKSKNHQFLRISSSLGVPSDRYLSLYQCERTLEAIDPGWFGALKSAELVKTPDGDATLGDVKMGKAMEKLRELRNRSIVAHGMEAVSKENAAQSLRVGKTFLYWYFSREREFIDSYPLKGECMEAVIEVVSS